MSEMVNSTRFLLEVLIEIEDKGIENSKYFPLMQTQAWRDALKRVHTNTDRGVLSKDNDALDSLVMLLGVSPASLKERFGALNDKETS